jgi:hypothetical protein
MAKQETTTKSAKSIANTSQARSEQHDLAPVVEALTQATQSLAATANQLMQSKAGTCSRVTVRTWCATNSAMPFWML